MNDDPIKTYIEEILFPLLNSYISNPNITQKVTMDIENRLTSLIYHWNDINFRNVILFTGMEEAYFYKPDDCNLEIKALVVVAIRNSLIEDLSSTDKAARSLGLQKPVIDDKDIPVITKQAICFFSGIDLDKLSTQLSFNNEDPYAKLPSNYPVTWKALSHLCELSKQCHIYSQLIEPQLKLDDYNVVIDMQNDSNLHIDVQSGMDEEFSHGLSLLLNSVINGETKYFFVDSLKMITRHIEKLFKVMELVLRSNKPIVTCNFYINNGYVARRKKLLRPAHSTKEINEKLENFGGLRKTHAQALKYIKKHPIQG